MTTRKSSRTTQGTPEAEAPAKAKGESTRVRAADVIDTVYEAVQAAGGEGISLKDLAEVTSLRYRVVHNVTWVLETKAEKIRRVGEGRKVRYAATQPAAKRPARKRTTRKATPKAA